MKYRSENQRRAVMASIRQRMARFGQTVHQAMGATPQARARLLKRLLIGAAVTGGVGVVAGLAAHRRQRWLTPLLAKIATAGVGGTTLGTALATMRDNLDERRRMLTTAARRHSSALSESGASLVRNLPVEAAVAKGIDVGFGMGEGLIHKTAAHHVGQLERLAAAKLGGLQSLTTAHAAGMARGAHRRLFPQPTGSEDLKTLRDWNTLIEPPDLSALSKPRSLRTQYLEQRTKLGAKALWNDLVQKNQLQNFLITGALDPKTLTDFGHSHNIRDRKELAATVQWLGLWRHLGVRDT